MGYSRDMQGRLCCDKCDESGGVRRHNCPYNYCQAWALCPKCWKEERQAFKEAHETCRIASARLAAELAEREAHPERVVQSAYGDWCTGTKDRVLVSTYARTWYMVPTEVYHAPNGKFVSDAFVPMDTAEAEAMVKAAYKR